MEIERKFAVNILPGNLEQYECKKIEQGYLCHNPILRIRKSNDIFYLTYKSKKGIEKREGKSAIVNHEVELPLTEEAYYDLKQKTDGNMVCKTRYLIPLESGLTVELDIFEGRLKGLVFAEVEFPNVLDADNFTPPSWLGKDISTDRRFSNHYLSQLENPPVI
ncbi:MAG: adenylate cyclase [Herbinix sp.]|jgi:CYTH domain-containing protein|nr:adenylate cyclase [Herbinix sp.]